MQNKTLKNFQSIQRRHKGTMESSHLILDNK